MSFIKTVHLIMFIFGVLYDLIYTLVAILIIIGLEEKSSNSSTYTCVERGTNTKYVHICCCTKPWFRVSRQTVVWCGVVVDGRWCARGNMGRAARHVLRYSVTVPRVLWIECSKHQITVLTFMLDEVWMDLIVAVHVWGIY